MMTGPVIVALFFTGGDMDLKSNPVVAAIILGVFIVVAVLIYRYTSPFQQCMRMAQSEGFDNPYYFCGLSTQGR